MTTGLVYDPRFLAHDTGPGHPERPQRLIAAIAAIDAQDWRTDLRDFTSIPVDHATLERVHDRAYIKRVAAACRDGQPFLDSMDVAISRESYEIALLAAGAPIVLADAVMAGAVANGFALVRPPGHHAETATALGFCLFNNVAVLARHLQHVHGVDKVAIVDWDVHHGNGTQHTFEADPSVLYASTHQYPFYPGTGSADEIGVGPGRGTIVNCPLPAGATDSAIERAFQERILPALSAFAPEFVIVSAGFDAHRDDPLAQLALSTACFGWMTDRLLEVADASANGRLVAVLEGGYNVERTGECIVTHLAHLQGRG